jgi:hypothetical protein
MYENIIKTTKLKKKKKQKGSRAPVAHACNPSHSGGRDQEDFGSKPAQANSSARPYLEKPFKNRAGRVAQGEGTRFKPQYHRKKKKNTPERRCIGGIRE